METYYQPKQKLTLRRLFSQTIWKKTNALYSVNVLWLLLALALPNKVDQPTTNKLFDSSEGMMEMATTSSEDVFACTHQFGGDDTSNSGNCPSELKWDLGFGDGDTEMVYLKICGEFCCGDIQLIVKNGGISDCGDNLIPGPQPISGVASFTLEEIGFWSGCDPQNFEKCGTETMGNLDNGNSYKFHGYYIDPVDGCSYWYYELTSRVGNAISHFGFSRLGAKSCCVPSAKCDLTDITVECDNVPAQETQIGNVFTDIELCGSVDYQMLLSETTTPGSCTGEYTLTRTYTLVVDGIEIAECVQVIDVEDTTPPAITCPDVITPVECPGLPVFGDATATDDCDNDVEITYVDVRTEGCGNSYSVTRTWTATDDCGNTSSCSRTIDVEDTTPPVITCPDVITPVECPGLPVFGDATATDDCDNDVEITYVDVRTEGCGNSYSVTRTWTATDDCGNTSSCSRTIDVEDTTPPVITCPDVITPVECPGLPVFGDATATDDCDNCRNTYV